LRYELIAYGTENRGYSEDIRYREYTTSERKAKLFEQIPKIQFSDSGHGVVFHSRKMEYGQKKEKEIFMLSKYVRTHLDLIAAQEKPEKIKRKNYKKVFNVAKKIDIFLEGEENNDIRGVANTLNGLDNLLEELQQAVREVDNTD